MKFVPGPKKDAPEPVLIYRINSAEESLLLAMLRLYPVLENRHHRISRDPKAAASAEQHLLEESMAQQRVSHKKKVETLFHNPQRFFKEALGDRHLVLTAAQLEWLLQVLNDVRVGSWMQLGCPDLEKPAPLNLSRASTRSLQAMHICGQFQLALLEGVK